MVTRIVLAVVLGGGIGLAIGYLGHSLGGQCALLCNPYISTGLGVVIGLMIASRAGAVGSLAKSQNLIELISETSYRETVGAPNKVILVEFYTQQCPACRRQLPVLNSLADRFAGRADVALVDVRQLTDVARKEGIEVVPTMLIFSQGRRVAEVRGLKSEQELSELLEKHLAALENTGRDQNA